MQIIKQKTKTLITRDNGRSADAIAPNFIYGCLGGCMNSYCYVGRYNHDRVYINENINHILLSMKKWLEKQRQLKKQMVEQFTELYSKYFSPENIRYIF